MKMHRDSEGRLHREDGPAIEDENGSWAWFCRGQLHRDGAPAVRLVFKDGRVEEQYWVEGKEIT
jgi:hypothetical protein